MRSTDLQEIAIWQSCFRYQRPTFLSVRLHDAFLNIASVRMLCGREGNVKDFLLWVDELSRTGVKC
ncbi:uncharacterized protein RHO25_006240 [Cercospora beticola]|uniref:Uncharacterized protein n=1 Tax=Cercospora beticola TaxID=122368 RepID=A0ABZ0NQ71_CERBT|nr:hypothetical protein RHO25_006240 [Cercospora beticola]